MSYFKQRFILLFQGLLILPVLLKAQEPVRLANYMHNQIVFNPAATGIHTTQLNSGLVSRLQWTGFSGAPVAHIAWADYRFPRNKTAVGLTIGHDRYGGLRRTDILVSYAYKLDLSHKTRLSMGLRGGVGIRRYNGLVLQNIWDPDDPLKPEDNTMEATLPKVGFGMQLNSGNLYAGIAAPDLLVIDPHDVLGNKGRSFFEKKRNYVVMGGYKIKLSNTYELYPNVLIAYYTASGLTMDISMIGEISNYFWAGATYSTSRTYSLLAGTHISSRVRFAYAYQFRTGKEFSTMLSSHEANLLVNLHGLVKSGK